MSHASAGAILAATLALAVPALGAPCEDAKPYSPMDVAIEGYPARSFDMAVNSISRGYWFRVGGYSQFVRNATVTFTLPAGSPSARFVEIVNGEVRELADPRRAVVSTGADCWGLVPFFISDGAGGEFELTAESAQTNIQTLTPTRVRVQNVAAPAQSKILGGTLGGYSTPGFMAYAHVTGAFPRLHPVRVEPAAGSLEGIPVTFRLPTSGPGGRFASGALEATVLSDVAGLAQIPGIFSNGVVGGFAVTASAPGYPDITAYGLVNAGQTQSRMVYPAPLPSKVVYGEGLFGELQVAFRGLPCDWPLPETPDGLVGTRLDGALLGTQRLLFYVGSSCVEGSFNATGSVVLPADLRFGTYRVTAEYSGAPAYEPSSTEFTVEVTPHFAGAASEESGIVKAGIYGGMFKCHLAEASMRPSTSIPKSPPGVDVPHGLFSYAIDSCRYESNFGEPPPRDDSPQRLLLQFPRALPAGASVWTYASRRPGGQPEWFEIPATIDGDFVRVELTDGGPTDQTGRDGIMRGIVAVAVPKTSHVKWAVEGLWWGGPQQNGWGVSLARSLDSMFGTFFVYDANGRAQWIVMPGGAWNADYTEFSGDLYIPRGSWFGNYDASHLNVGGPIGSAKLSFSGADAAVLTYRLPGASGTKTLQRQAFGDNAAPTRKLAGLWWGGPLQSGWGLSVHQQGNTLFNVWYTYDVAGQVVWYVMPGGSWINPRVYTGPLYRTRSSPWAGETYNPSAFVAERTGSMTIAFDDDNNAYLTYVVDGVEATRSITRQPF